MAVLTKLNERLDRFEKYHPKSKTQKKKK